MKRGVLVAAALAALAVPPAAEAHHSIMVNEVAASSAGGAEFVELKMYRQGQNGVASTQLDVYGPLGLKQTFNLTSEVPNGQNQSTILIGSGSVAADFTFPGLGAALDPAGGAACFAEAAPPDCVGWGTFTGGGSLPFPGAGVLAPAMAEGISLQRIHSRGCATALDTPDDTDSSAADLIGGAPTPRSNSLPPEGTECVPCDGVDATIVGTDGAETLRGTPGPDVILAKAGADTVYGLGGNDLICGDIGKDRLVGGAGRDTLSGGRGKDTCVGGRGRDVKRSCERGPKKGPKA